MRYGVTMHRLKTSSLPRKHSADASTDPWLLVSWAAGPYRKVPESVLCALSGCVIIHHHVKQGRTQRRFHQPFLQPREVGRRLALQGCKSLTKHMLRESLQLRFCHLSKSQHDVSPERHFFSGDAAKYLPTEAPEVENAPYILWNCVFFINS